MLNYGNVLIFRIQSHLIVLHYLPQSASQHAAGHLVIPHFSQKPVRPEELRLPHSATQLPPPAASEQGLQGAHEGARQQPGEKARGLPLLRLPLRRGVPDFVGVVRRGEDRDWTVRVTGNDPRELLGVDVHGLGAASQHLRDDEGTTVNDCHAERRRKLCSFSCWLVS